MARLSPKRPAAVAQVCAGAGVQLPVPIPLPVLPEARSQPPVRVCTQSAAGCWSPSRGASLRPYLQFCAPSRGGFPLPSVGVCGMLTETPPRRALGQQSARTPQRSKRFNRPPRGQCHSFGVIWSVQPGEEGTGGTSSRFTISS